RSLEKGGARLSGVRPTCQFLRERGAEGRERRGDRPATKGRVPSPAEGVAGPARPGAGRVAGTPRRRTSRATKEAGGASAGGRGEDGQWPRGSRSCRAAGQVRGRGA